MTFSKITQIIKTKDSLRTETNRLRLISRERKKKKIIFTNEGSGGNEMSRRQQKTGKKNKIKLSQQHVSLV